MDITVHRKVDERCVTIVAGEYTDGKFCLIPVLLDKPQLLES